MLIEKSDKALKIEKTLLAKGKSVKSKASKASSRKFVMEPTLVPATSSRSLAFGIVYFLVKHSSHPRKSRWYPCHTVFGKEFRHPPLTLLDCSLLSEATDQFAVLVLHASTRVHNPRGRKRTISALYIGPHYNNIVLVNPPRRGTSSADVHVHGEERSSGRDGRGSSPGRGEVAWHLRCSRVVASSRCALLRRNVVAQLLRLCTM